MKALNELCRSALAQNASNGPLREACALPRSPADMRPLPEPQAASSFDSSWEVMQAANESAKPQ